MKRAIFPGSFDPFTVGHESIVLRGLEIFDEIIVAVGYNAEKRNFISVENRMRLISDVFKGNDKIKVDSYDYLTVQYCLDQNAKYILRGLRTAADFEYERAIAQVNKQMYNQLDTVFLLCNPEHTPVNSSIVRDIIRHKGNVDKFMPSNIKVENYL